MGENHEETQGKHTATLTHPKIVAYLIEPVKTQNAPFELRGCLREKP
jgi:hypothetical protein